MFSKNCLKTPTQLAQHVEMRELINKRCSVRSFEQDGARLTVKFVVANGEKKGALFTTETGYYDCATPANAAATTRELEKRRCVFG